MKINLGLDIGPNSIGWAIVECDEKEQPKQIINIGSRIIPMSQDILGNFEKGVSISQTAQRTEYRGIRRLLERHLLRRERLHRVLHILGYLPEHYDSCIGWNKTDNKTYGKFINHSEPKIAWQPQTDGSMRFLFMDSFREMLNDFSKHQPQLLENGKKIPLDWTLYYLRKKALTQAISKEELAWILLNFNKKRGYYQLRGEEEDVSPTKKEEYEELKVVDIKEVEGQKENDKWYQIHLENGGIYLKKSKIPLDDWIGKNKQFIITTEYEKDGKTLKTYKSGKQNPTYRMPKEDDWALIKKRTERQIENSNTTVGSFIYEHILENPFDKIRGQLIRTIERKYYKTELEAILTEQSKYHHELTNKDILKICAEELYQHNIAHRNSLLNSNMLNLLINDVIFYQRPLKSKKSLIDNCPYESYSYVDKETGEIKTQHIKCIAKSNPYYQEFRLWQFIQNLKLYDIVDDKEVTNIYLNSFEDYNKLFDFLNDKDEINQDALLKEFFKLKKEIKGDKKEYPIYWNYIRDNTKKYPCNQTRYQLLMALKRAGIDKSWLDDDTKRQYRLWHLLYSVELKDETAKALRKLKDDDSFVEAFLKIKPFKKEYGAYSEKAIKKLLAIMRMGKAWREENICNNTLLNINNIIKQNSEEKLLNVINNSKRNFNQISDFQALPEYLACYVVYGRHSEVADIQQWNTPDKLMGYIKAFKQHALRNPVVEQVILETLRLVHDIFKMYGKINEIHVEMAREMKRTAQERANDTTRILNNETTNLRIKYLLEELKNDPSIKDVRPLSPIHQEKMRIYEQTVLDNLSKDDKQYDDISKISKKDHPTASELTRYKLWLEQKYQSPYTGKVISLNKLFTKAYEIEHIIPQSRYFDNSFNNKVICEAEVNLLKTNMLGYEFIKNKAGETVYCGDLGNVTIFTEEQYKNFVNEHYKLNKTKRQNLLREDIPENFTNRQLNDTRYIAKVVTSLLSNIVREEGEKEATAKKLITVTGGITDRLKHDWGLNDVWNSIVYHRYERLNKLTNSNKFGDWKEEEGKRYFLTNMPLELQAGYNKKRIDHRHHAMDALVIACANRNIVNYLNNVNAKTYKQREDLRQLLCDKNRIITKPWDAFTQDAKNALNNMIVSFKNNVRIINKTSNHYVRYNEAGKKINDTQQGNEMWAIRKPLHKETVFGKVNLIRIETIPLTKALDNISAICNKKLRAYIKDLQNNHFNKEQIIAHFKSTDYRWDKQNIKKVQAWTCSDDKKNMVATRKPLDTSFDKKRIEAITDTGIQKILLSFLNEKNGDPNIAFTPEGIEEMNKNIILYNNGKQHLPIRKVRISETLGNKYQVGQTGNKTKKYVETEKGTNLYFAIYENQDAKREFRTIPLNEVIERLKQNLSPVPEVNENNTPLKFYLSPNNLIYLPTEEERDLAQCYLNKKNIYKFISASDKQAYFIPYSVATTLVDKVEFQSLNKMERALTGEMIKETCWKLEVDRLGNITNIIK